MDDRFLNTLIQKINTSNFIDNLNIQVKLIYFFYSNYKITNSEKNIYNNYIQFLNNKLIDNSIDHFTLTKEEVNTLYDFFINDKTIIKNLEEKYLIDIIYEIYYNDKKLKYNIKEFDLFYVNKKTNDIINEIISTHNYKNVCNLFSNFGNMIYNIYNESCVYDLYNFNPKINTICYYNFLIYNKINNVNITTCDILTSNKNIKTYDLILGEIPINIKNLIYTNCNSKIKSLKIRGTKSEPLIFQFISQLLNTNGKAILITPNSFLFGDSNQHILTRKYLLEHFYIKIIDLNNKKSIIILDEQNIINERNISFKFIENKENINIIINENEIINNNYSFYYYNYLKQENKNIETTMKIKDLINIYNNKYKDYDKNSDYIYYYKYNQFNIDKIKNTDDFEYIFITKNNDLYNQNFINIYLKNIFKKYNKQITKGIMNQLNIDALNNIDVKIPSYEMQNIFIDYYNNINTINNINNIQSSILENIKNNTIEKYIQNSKKIELSKITNITHETKKINTIYINKNTNLAGYINLSTGNFESNTNKYYINIFNGQYNQNYLYYILLYYQQQFINHSNNNKTICLAKKFIESFMIPDIDLNIQIKLNDEISNINLLQQQYKNINDGNLFNGLIF
jgi:hypothetical protein